MTTYNFTTLHTNANGAVVQVDDASKYGYFDRQDGSEGGGLWFDVSTLGTKGLELVDYDGVSELPKRVVNALTSAGYHVDSSF